MSKPPVPVTPDTAETDAGFVPGWMRFAPYLGQPPLLSTRQWRVFSLIVAASIFNQYDVALLQLALPNIQNALGVSDADLGSAVALIRLGSIPAFFLLAAADWLGRRRILLLTITGYTLATAATAFTTHINSFIAMQFLARLFITAEMALAVVFITEEFPAKARGWGVGAFFALASYGFAMAALIFALIDLIPFGWRALYLLGLLPLAILMRLRRALPETAHFSALSPSSNPPSPIDLPATPSHPTNFIQARWLAVWHLLRAYPGRLALAGGAVLFLNLGGASATFFDPTYLQSQHGWSPWQISLMTMGAGFVALFGSAYAGQLGDRWGRKPVAGLFIGGGTLTVVAFYNLFGLWLPLLWAAMIFAFQGIQVTFSAFNAELFPTQYRGSATGFRTILATLGAAAGLTLHGVLTSTTGSPWRAVWLLGLVMLPALACIYFLPETSGRHLDAQLDPQNDPQNDPLPEQNPP